MPKRPPTPDLHTAFARKYSTPDILNNAVGEPPIHKKHFADRNLVRCRPDVAKLYHTHRAKQHVALALRGLRKRRELTQAEIVERSGRTPPVISGSEPPSGPLPSRGLLRRYAEAYRAVVIVGFSVRIGVAPMTAAPKLGSSTPCAYLNQNLGEVGRFILFERRKLWFDHSCRKGLFGPADRKDQTKYFGPQAKTFGAQRRNTLGGNQAKNTAVSEKAAKRFALPYSPRTRA